MVEGFDDLQVQRNHWLRRHHRGHPPQPDTPQAGTTTATVTVTATGTAAPKLFVKVKVARN